MKPSRPEPSSKSQQPRAPGGPLASKMQSSSATKPRLQPQQPQQSSSALPQRNQVPPSLFETEPLPFSWNYLSGSAGSLDSIAGAAQAGASSSSSSQNKRPAAAPPGDDTDSSSQPPSAPQKRQKVTVRLRGRDGEPVGPSTFSRQLIGASLGGGGGDEDAEGEDEETSNRGDDPEHTESEHEHEQASSAGATHENGHDDEEDDDEHQHSRSTPATSIADRPPTPFYRGSYETEAAAPMPHFDAPQPIPTHDNDEENTKPSLLSDNDMDLLEIALQEFAQSPSRLRWPKSYERWKVLRKGNPGPTPSMMKVAAELRRLQDRGDARFQDVAIPEPSAAHDVILPSERPTTRQATQQSAAPRHAETVVMDAENDADDGGDGHDADVFSLDGPVEHRANSSSWTNAESRLLIELFLNAQSLSQQSIRVACNVVAKLWRPYIDGERYLQRTAGGIDSRIRLIGNKSNHPLYAKASKVKSLFHMPDRSARLAQARPLPAIRGAKAAAVAPQPTTTSSRHHKAPAPAPVADEAEEDLIPEPPRGARTSARVARPRQPSPVKVARSGGGAAPKPRGRPPKQRVIQRTPSSESLPPAEHEDESVETENEDSARSQLAKHEERIKRLEANIEQLLESNRKLVASQTNAEERSAGQQQQPLRSSMRRNAQASAAGGATAATQGGSAGDGGDQWSSSYTFNPHTERMEQQRRDWQAAMRMQYEADQAQSRGRSGPSNAAVDVGGAPRGRDASPQGPPPDYSSGAAMPPWGHWGPGPGGPMYYGPAPPSGMQMGGGGGGGGGDYGPPQAAPPSRVWGNATPYRPYG